MQSNFVIKILGRPHKILKINIIFRRGLKVGGISYRL